VLPLVIGRPQAASGPAGSQERSRPRILFGESEPGSSPVPISPCLLGISCADTRGKEKYRGGSFTVESEATSDHPVIPRRLRRSVREEIQALRLHIDSLSYRKAQRTEFLAGEVGFQIGIIMAGGEAHPGQGA